MENPKINSVFVHEDFEKWPKASLRKTTLKNLFENKKLFLDTKLIILKNVWSKVFFN
jgi:hypothetical protein